VPPNAHQISSSPTKHLPNIIHVGKHPPAYINQIPSLNPTNSRLVRLLAVHATGALHQLGRVVDGAECAPGRVYALDHQPSRDDDPEGVHQDEVAPVVRGLGTRVCDVEDVVVEHGGRVVENVAIELAERDDELQRVAERVVVRNKGGGDERAGSPESLSQ
jgi:hypothetical protein